MSGTSVFELPGRQMFPTPQVPSSGIIHVSTKGSRSFNQMSATLQECRPLSGDAVTARRVGQWLLPPEFPLRGISTEWDDQ